MSLLVVTCSKRSLASSLTMKTVHSLSLKCPGPKLSLNASLKLFYARAHQVSQTHRLLLRFPCSCFPFAATRVPILLSTTSLAENSCLLHQVVCSYVDIHDRCTGIQMWTQMFIHTQRPLLGAHRTRFLPIYPFPSVTSSDTSPVAPLQILQPLLSTWIRISEALKQRLS